jgi:N-acetylmuramoyl-L-alanine amidase
VRRINEIVIHCSATPEDQYFGPDDLAVMHAARNIRNPGGYGYLVDNNGNRHKVRGWKKQGAHVFGHNTDTVGICYSGGIVSGGNPNKASDAKDTRTIAQKVEIVNLLVDLLKKIKVYQPIDHIMIKGHRDYSPDTNGNGVVDKWEYMKQCPCYNAIPEYENILKQPALQ